MMTRTTDQLLIQSVVLVLVCYVCVRISSTLSAVVAYCLLFALFISFGFTNMDLLSNPMDNQVLNSLNQGSYNSFFFSFFFFHSSS